MRKKKKKINNKKVLMLVVVLVIIILAIFGGIANSAKKKEAAALAIEYYNKNTEDVDKGVTKYLNSKEYSKMSGGVQKAGVKALLQEYEKNGKIEDIDYSGKNATYSFTYTYGEGSGKPGSVKLKNK